MAKLEVELREGTVLALPMRAAAASGPEAATAGPDDEGAIYRTPFHRVSPGRR